METNIDDVPNMLLADILVKLPIRTITILKIVSKRWKSLIESVLFRNLFISLNQNSSCSWSLLPKIHYNNITRDELIAFYECERWGLPRSLGSYMDSGTHEIGSYVVKATSSGLLLIQTLDQMYYVGNPMSQEWVKISLCTHQESKFHFNRYGLATNVDENGVVLGYKRVIFNTNLTLHIYTSETGQWTCEKVSCPDTIPWTSMLYPEPISLNKILYWIEPGESYFGEDVGGVIAIDMYNLGGYKCLIIPFPNQDLTFRQHSQYSKTWYRRACTTSKGFVTYINMVSETRMKVWRLKKNIYEIDEGDYWELLWEIELGHVGYIPIVMHPFDSDIVYLWSSEKNGLVSMNLRKQDECMIDEESRYGCIISGCIEESYVIIPRVYRGLILSPQFFPTVWIDSVPRPPRTNR